MVLELIFPRKRIIARLTAIATFHSAPELRLIWRMKRVIVPVKIYLSTACSVASGVSALVSVLVRVIGQIYVADGRN
jgi:hypothetical protein